MAPEFFRLSRRKGNASAVQTHRRIVTGARGAAGDDIDFFEAVHSWHFAWELANPRWDEDAATMAHLESECAATMERERSLGQANRTRRLLR